MEWPLGEVDGSSIPGSEIVGAALIGTGDDLSATLVGAKVMIAGKVG